QRAQAEIRSGRRLREAIYLTLCQVSNDLEAQAQATEFALRQRKNDFEQALDELKWQKKQVKADIFYWITETMFENHYVLNSQPLAA
ncbi:unnamed protein product, partial [Schistosoma curassoni]|uniref:Tektin n=1 Tax=Schistosoma curassoni TaxID=6186 RepID=A0A183L6Z0_9TREM